VERTNTNDKSWSDNRSSNDKSDRAGKSRQLDGYAVSYHPCTYCGKNHSPSACQLINHPEANKMGSGSTRHHTRSARSSFCRLKSFDTLLMYGDTAGNATDEWSNRKYSSPIIRIVLAVTTPSVLKMMQERIVRMVVNMKVSLLLRN